MNDLRQLPAKSISQFLATGSPLSLFQEAKEEKEAHLRDYWKIILKRQWTILAIFLITLTGTAIVTFSMKPIYRGTAIIQINKENPQIVDFKEMFAVNTMDTDYYQTQYKTLESRTLAKKVITFLKLAEHPEFLKKAESPFQKWKSNTFASLKSDNPSEGESEKEALLIDRFLSQLKIEPLRNSRLVKIHFESGSSALSTQVPNALAAAYTQHNLETRYIATQHAKEWLIGQLDDLKAKVEGADETLQNFAAKNDIISLDEKENVAVQRLSELNEALTKAEAQRMDKEALYKQTKEIDYSDLSSNEALPSILDNRLIMELKQSYIQLEAQYMKLSESYKPEYPEMVRLKQQIKTMQKRIETEIHKIITGIKNDYESGLRKEALLRQAFVQQKAKVQEMKEKAIQYNILKREADANRDLYKSLLQRMKEAGVSAGIMASNIQVLDNAELRAKPYKPKKALNLLIASLVGLFLGVGLAFFLEYFDDTVKTSDEIEQITRLPSFGMVPEISYEKRSRSGNGRSYPVEMVTYGNPKSILSEAFRNIRTSILLSFSEKPPKKIAITSPNPGEGKTTTVVNTSISLSQTGGQVLIIDADMRKPRIHQVFGDKNEVGLSSFLSGNIDIDSVLKRSTLSNLYYIPSGPIPPNPTELIGSEIFRKMIESLEKRFNHIVIDCPPVLGFADSIILSTYVDGLILVVSGGKTPKETLKRAKEGLQQVNARILGVVINRVNLRRHDYGYHYYRYHSYYGKESKRKELPVVSPLSEDQHADRTEQRLM